MEKIKVRIYEMEEEGKEKITREWWFEIKDDEEIEPHAVDSLLEHPEGSKVVIESEDFGLFVYVRDEKDRIIKVKS